MSSVVVITPAVGVYAVVGGLLAAALFYGGSKIYKHIKQKKNIKFCAAAFTVMKKAIEQIKEKIESYHLETADKLAFEKKTLIDLEKKITRLETKKINDQLVDDIEKINYQISSIQQKTILAKINEEETQDEISSVISEFKNFFKEHLSDSNYVKKISEFSEEFQRITASTGLYTKLSKLSELKEKTADIQCFARLSKKIEFNNSEDELSREEFKRLNIKETLLSQIKHYSARINSRIYDENIAGLEKEAVDCGDIDRLKLIKENVKLVYSRLKEDISLTIIFKERLNSIKLELSALNTPEQYFETIDNLLKQTIIKRPEFTDVLNKINAFVISEENKKLKSSFLRKSSEILNKMGYSLISENEISGVDSGKIVYIDTKWPDYKVMVKTNENGELVTRLARETADMVSSENNSVYQKQKDCEIAEQWCADYDNFLVELKKAGIDYSVILRKELENEDIIRIPKRGTRRRSEKQKDLIMEKKSNINY